ncbi:UDP-N-acetylglucosamine--N-acetylmuramyl-(pentapeptide) pyrophosphoryl-undecaprenol N-acetylglucosamine transferase [uncultured Bifidobacterium sp.]|uniref:UDP-N-acetylglucosamine--N-acetylmuramyl- (pentapeptide) pyrophosphoryl-undecaprenol N-acetylglucosamine transferase n=1 Tax=uncultured Bifidobacterium sp. TaxID=165187 RepID=UPI0028DB4EBF|nr:UDP-N-acetylglucosamine--N-acetylmuramyl-(pentapeptide) pyrophosphoryl-undecaprenol N-acetylglucosamine transferase [uncultured Bifidobacterium sp.]
MDQVHVVLAGGGTAGHVNPLLSVAAALHRLDRDVVTSVIGTSVGLEARLVPQAGYALDAIEKVPFPRRPGTAMLRFPSRWLREVGRVESILRSRRACVVVGFGGYASAPAYWAAHRMGIPIALHEQNARAGMANRLGARWADVVATAYDGTGLSPRRGVDAVRVGLPLRPAIAELCRRRAEEPEACRRECAAALGLDPDRPVLVVTGGSLGAVSLNRSVASCASELLAHSQVIHLTGRGKADEVRSLVAASAGEGALGDLNPARIGQGGYRVAEYLERIDLAFGCADLVVCRSGAGSVSELAALGLPAVYVPLPIGNGEQRFNAEPVVRAGGGMLVADRDFSPDYVRATIPRLLGDHDLVTRMGGNAWSYGIRDAAERMAGLVLGLSGRDSSHDDPGDARS